MLILGLETSCDETGVALYDTGRGLLADALFSQVDIHVEYGGVVPELASRDHIRKTLPLVEEVLARAGCLPADMARHNRFCASRSNRPMYPPANPFFQLLPAFLKPWRGCCTATSAPKSFSVRQDQVHPGHPRSRPAALIHQHAR